MRAQNCISHRVSNGGVRGKTIRQRITLLKRCSRGWILGQRKIKVTPLLVFCAPSKRCVDLLMTGPFDHTCVTPHISNQVCAKRWLVLASLGSFASTVGLSSLHGRAFAYVSTVAYARRCTCQICFEQWDCCEEKLSRRNRRACNGCCRSQDHREADSRDKEK